MIAERPGVAALAAFAADVCVIGSGSVGIVTALALADRGFRVLVLESGGEAAEPAAEDLARSRRTCNPDDHFEPHTAVARRLGGTSNLWAGRCVPFDPIDFRARPWLGLDGLADRRRPTSRPTSRRRSTRSAPARRSSRPRSPASPPTRRSAATRSSAGATCRGSRSATPGRWPGAATSWWRCAPRSPASATAPDGGDRRARRSRPGRAGGRSPPPASSSPPAATPAPGYCCSSRRATRARFGGAGGPLGRFYMGHLQRPDRRHRLRGPRPCTTASTTMSTPTAPTCAAASCPREATQEAEAPRQRRLLAGGAADRQRRAPLRAALGGLPRALAGAARPAADRRAGAAEARRPAALPARHPPRERRCATCRAPSASRPAFLWRNRVAKMRLPGFFLKNPARRYGLEYHAEQLPNPDSRLTLAGRARRLGQRRLAHRPALRARPTPPRWSAPTPRSRPGSARNRLARARATTAPAPERGGGGAARTPGTARTRSAPSAWPRTPGQGVVDGRCRGLRHTRPLRRLDRGAADLRPGQPDAHRGAARPAPRRRPCRRAGVSGLAARGSAPLACPETTRGTTMRRVTLGKHRHRDLLPRLRLRLARPPGRRGAAGSAALAAAYDAGVTWFDLAPLYGGGRRGGDRRALPARPRRDGVQICSKVGPRARGGGAGPEGGADAGGARARCRRCRRCAASCAARGAQARASPAADARSSSPARSRRACAASAPTTSTSTPCTASPAAALTEEVAARARGHPRRRQGAGGRGGERRGRRARRHRPRRALRRGPGGAAAAPARRTPCSPPPAPPASASIVHSVFGIDGQPRRAEGPRRRRSGASARRPDGQGQGDLDCALARRLLERAFALNPDGVVLVSMFSPRAAREPAARRPAARGSP